MRWLSVERMRLPLEELTHPSVLVSGTDLTTGAAFQS